ncbi:MAG TPA: hypothetical protein VNE71_04155, partial [Myxococcota bacterium]|nr:hypothetical protein [Myxococcota bacterium]
MRRAGRPRGKNPRIAHASRDGNERKQFRLVHYSIQDDHAHLIVEADGVASLPWRARGWAAVQARTGIA